jgi:serine/threonine protein kinase HipA of HipAB toxin-antitoxin module
MNHFSGGSAGERSDAGHAAALECAAIAADLERLKALINDAGDKLLASFNQVSEIAPRLDGSAGERAELGAAVTSAVTALQFQDMATQLTQHAQARLNALERCLVTLAPDVDDPLLAATRMQPVRQSHVSAGSIELF